MGFMDGLKKLTQPYDDDEDFFEGADQSFRPQPKAEQKPAVSAAQMTFENSFADTSGGPAPAEEAQPKKGATPRSCSSAPRTLTRPGSWSAICSRT